MIYIFYGADRVKAEKEAKKILGKSYETIDMEPLGPSDLPDIFLGTTLFEAHRKILLKDFFANKVLVPELVKYLNTPHEIVLLENTFDKRQTTQKELLKNPSVKVQEFKNSAETLDKYLAFNVYDLALKDGKKAVELLRPAESTENPYLVLGAWGSKAIKRFEENPRDRSRKTALKELAKLDILLKTSSFSNTPWPVLELFLLRLKNL